MCVRVVGRVCSAARSIGPADGTRSRGLRPAGGGAGSGLLRAGAAPPGGRDGSARRAGGFQASCGGRGGRAGLRLLRRCRAREEELGLQTPGPRLGPHKDSIAVVTREQTTGDCAPVRPTGLSPEGKK